ncbi:MAG: hypothetical protein WCI74_20280, partial [Actinomycetes bacterium]
MKRALVSLGVGPHQELLNLVEPTFRAYADRFGYELVTHTESVDGSRPVVWSKIPLIVQALRTYDEVFWVDADAIVLRFDRDVATCVRPDTEFAWAVHEYGLGSLPNAGVLFVRATDQAFRALETAYAQHDLIDHPWSDNAALLRTLGYGIPGFEPKLERPLVDLRVEHL